MAIDELAAYLKIPKSTLFKLAQESNVPAQKVGRHQRSHEEGVDRGLTERPEKRG